MDSRKLATGLVCALAAGSAVADHSPGYTEDDTQFIAPIPGQETFNGGAAMVTLIGPLAEDEIYHATFEIEYHSDGTTPASDLLIWLRAPVNDVYVTVELTGAELGFGEGPGVFKATYETDAFNGEIWQSPPGFPHTVLDLELGAVDGAIDGTGYFVDSSITFDLTPADCPGDFNGDGQLDILDFLAFQEAFLAGEPEADCNADEQLDVLDFICFQDEFSAGCP